MTPHSQVPQAHSIPVTAQPMGAVQSIRPPGETLQRLWRGNSALADGDKVTQSEIGALLEDRNRGFLRYTMAEERYGRPFVEAKALTRFFPKANVPEVAYARIYTIIRHALGCFDLSGAQKFHDYLQQRIAVGVWARFDEKHNFAEISENGAVPGEIEVQRIKSELATRNPLWAEIFQLNQINGLGPKEVAAKLEKKPAVISEALQHIKLLLPTVMEHFTPSADLGWRASLLRRVSDEDFLAVLTCKEVSAFTPAKGGAVTKWPAEGQEFAITMQHIQKEIVPKIVEKIQQRFPETFAGDSPVKDAEKLCRVAAMVALRQFKQHPAGFGEFLIERLMTGLWKAEVYVDNRAAVHAYLESGSYPGKAESGHIIEVLRSQEEKNPLLSGRATIFEQYYLKGRSAAEIAVALELQHASAVYQRLSHIDDLIRGRSIEEIRVAATQMSPSPRKFAIDHIERPTAIERLTSAIFFERLASFGAADGPNQEAFATFVAEERPRLEMVYVERIGASLARRLANFLPDCEAEQLQSYVRIAFEAALDAYKVEAGSLEAFFENRLRIGVFGPPRSAVGDTATEIIPGEGRLQEVQRSIAFKNHEWVATFRGIFVEGLRYKELALREGVTESAIANRFQAIKQSLKPTDGAHGWRHRATRDGSDEVDTINARLHLSFPIPSNLGQVCEMFGLDTELVCNVNATDRQRMVVDALELKFDQGMSKAAWREFAETHIDFMSWGFEEWIASRASNLRRFPPLQALNPDPGTEGIVAIELFNKLTATYDPSNIGDSGQRHRITFYLNQNFQNRAIDVVRVLSPLSRLETTAITLLLQAFERLSQRLERPVHFNLFDPDELLHELNVLIEEKRQAAELKGSEFHTRPFTMEALHELLALCRNHGFTASQAGNETEELPEADFLNAFVHPTELGRGVFDEPSAADMARTLIELLPSANHRRVLELVYLEGKTLKEAGELMSVSESRACQLKNEALPRLLAIARQKELTLEFVAEVVAAELDRKRFGF